MRKLLLCVLLLLTASIYGQYNYRCMMEFTDENCLKKLKKEKLLVPQGFGEEMDEALKLAVTKYWTACPYEFVHKSEITGGGTYFGFYVADNKEGFDPVYHNCTYFAFTSVAGLECKIYFDNDFKNTNKIVVGIDSDYKDMSYKIVQYVMLINNELKRMEVGLRKYYFDKNDHLENLAGYRFLVPEEYLYDNLLNADFLEKLPNCEFLPSEKIAERVKEQKGTENCAEILLAKPFGISKMYIVDLKTGKLLYFNHAGNSVATGKRLNSKDIKKLLKPIKL